MLTDLTLWMYALISIVSLYGFGLFAWWMWINGWRASSMYVYIMLLFAGELICHGTNFRARSLRDIDYAAYTEFLSSTWWSCRLVIILAILICIVTHMSYRAFWQRKKQ